MTYECSVDYDFVPISIEARDSEHAHEKARQKFNEMTDDGHSGMIRDMRLQGAECWEA